MITSMAKNINLNDYKNFDELSIYGIKGIVRLSVGREIIYRMRHTGIFDFSTEVLFISKIECIFAVTDKRIILIPIDTKYKSISFNHGDIDVSYYDQLFDKVFLLNIKDKKLLDFCENKLVFRMYRNQNSELNKVNYILQEHVCA